MLVWHQGALGDLLLSGPALAGLTARHPGVRLTGVGQPERWRLLAATLPLENIWDSGESLWSWLFTEDSPLPAALTERLAGFPGALIFSPRPLPLLEERLKQAGLAQVLRVPTLPEGRREPVWRFQGRRLAELGLAHAPQPLRLNLGPEARELKLPRLPGDGPWVAVAPGSGSSGKNWPLGGYWELTRHLAWEVQARVVWLAGPAEEGMLPYMRALSQAQGFTLWENQPLPRVAALLARCRLYIGGDSGLTHLAAAAGAPAVLALFGPTDPCLWAPAGEQVAVLTPGGMISPGVEEGRNIAPFQPQDLALLPLEAVVQAAARLL